MKIKLLLLCFLLGTFYANSQININVNFESGSLPTGWTQANGFISSVEPCSGTRSWRNTTTGSLTMGIYTSGYITTGNAIQVSYTGKSAGGAKCTLKYWNISQGGQYTVILDSQPSSCQTVSTIIPAGTIPAGNNIMFEWALSGMGGQWAEYVIDDIIIKEYVDQPTASSPQNFCVSAKVEDLIASGSNLKWYNSATGGTALAPTQALSNGSTYYVSQTINGLESARTPVSVSINAAPAQPVNSTPAINLSICSGNSTTLSVNGFATIQWFADNTTSTVLSTGNTFTTPVLNSTTTYYVGRFDGLCYSSRRPITVTVSASGVPTFTQQASVCETVVTSPLPTTSTNGISGTWSPAWISTPGSHTYTFTPNAGQCSSQTTTMSVTVNAKETPTFTQVAAICTGGTFTLPTTSTNGFTGTWSPAINNTATTTYTFTPTTGQCAATTTMTVTVNSQITPSFTQVPAICTGGTFTLPTTSNEGITGTWSPAINNTATTTYTFTPTAGQCATTKTMTVTVNSPVTPSFTQVPAICPEETLAPLPTTSNNGFTGTWSPALNNTQTTTYTFTPTAGQCATATTMQITVNASTTPIFSQTIYTICEGSASPLVNTSINGFSGTWSPAWNGAEGSYTYTFTPNSGQGCVATTTATVNVLGTNTEPEFTPIVTSCQGVSVTLPYTSNNGIHGTWAPAWKTNVGTHTYTFTPYSGQCSSITTTMTVTIIPGNPTPQFAIQNSLCSGVTSPLPTVSEDGVIGTWSPAWNPNAGGTYTFTATEGCYPTVTHTTTINTSSTSPDLPVNITPTSNETICAGNSTTLSVDTQAGTTVQWFEDNSTHIVIYTGSSYTTPVLNATKTYYVRRYQGNCYTPRIPVTVTVIPSETPTFDYIEPICAGATMTALPTTSNEGMTGTWSPALNNTATTTYTFTPGAGQCAIGITTITIGVTQNEVPQFTQVNPICNGDAVALPTNSTNGIAGTWSPAINNTATTTYTFTPNTGECAIGTASMQIVVNPLETPTFTQVNSICQGDALAALPTISNNGITGFWTPAVNNNATTTYTFIPASGFCTTGNQTMTIVVNPTAQTNLDTLVCHGEVFTFGTHTISSNGVYSKLLQTVAGCDSTVSLTVNYRLPITNTLTVQRCTGETYTFDGQPITTDGTHTAVFTSAAGCDSTVTLNITFVNSITASISASICSGDSYLLGSQELTTTGVYSETFQSVGGCDSIVNLTLTVLDLPTVAITNNNGTLEATTGFATYQWYKDGVIISGATGATYTPIQPGAYYVEVSDAAGCSSISTAISVTDAGLKGLVENAMHIYPNPATTTLTIELVQQTTIELVDMLGQTIQTHQLKSGVNTIDVSELVSGVYFIQTTDGSAIKFVVAK